jgi:hypothetical protein
MKTTQRTDFIFFRFFVDHHRQIIIGRCGGCWGEEDSLQPWKENPYLRISNSYMKLLARLDS